MDIIENIKDEIKVMYSYDEIIKNISEMQKKADEGFFSTDLPLFVFRKSIAEKYGIGTDRNTAKALESFDETIKYAEQSINLFSKNVESENKSNPYTQVYNSNLSLIALSHREKGIIEFNNKNYIEAYKEFDLARDKDPVSNSYALMIIAYELIYYITPPQIDGMIDTCIEVLNELSQNEVAIANYFLGIIYADNTLKRKNLNKAELYLSNAKRFGYKITDEEIKIIIESASKNEYYNEFSKAKKEWLLEREKNNSTNSKKKSGGCYVATCVYGSYDCPSVWTLRRFRDEILAKNIFGRMFINIYYAVSPIAVKLFGKYSWFHKLFKPHLDKLVNRLKENGIDDTPYNDR